MPADSSCCWVRPAAENPLVFSNLRRAPITLLTRIRDIPGVNAVEGRVVFDATLDVPGLDEPASARLVSLSTTPDSQLNRVNIRSGRMIEAGNKNEVLASESFATANALRPGDTLDAIINGRKETLRIVGVAISPEYVTEIKGSGAFPDNKRFGVLWMSYDALAAASNLQHAFNDVAITLAPHASAPQVIENWTSCWRRMVRSAPMPARISCRIIFWKTNWRRIASPARYCRRFSLGWPHS